MLPKVWSDDQRQDPNLAPFLLSDRSLGTQACADTEGAAAGQQRGLPGPACQLMPRGVPQLPWQPLSAHCPFLPGAPAALGYEHRPPRDGNPGFPGAPQGLAVLAEQMFCKHLWKAGGKVCFDRHGGFAN